jgi:REP element-mobilizing transposase RayT
MSQKSAEGEKRGWYSRNYLPHFDARDRVQMITIRQFDSLPKSVITRLRLERMDNIQTADERRELEYELDWCHGSSLLGRSEVAEIFEDWLFRLDGDRFLLFAYVVMPNHVHLLLEVADDVSLSEAMKALKGCSSRSINQALGRKGTFWYREYHDRFIRDLEHFHAAVRYIEMNPVKAKLFAAPGDWRYGSAWKGWV